MYSILFELRGNLLFYYTAEGVHAQQTVIV